MAIEFGRFGQTEKFDGMAQLFDQFYCLFEDVTVTVNGREFQGLTDILKSLCSVDFDHISEIGFGYPDL